MTRIQLIDLIKFHSKYYTEDVAYSVRYNELVDTILALPLDVPGGDEIDAIVYAACKDAYDPDGCVTEAYKLGIKIAINEILKRNTP